MISISDMGVTFITPAGDVKAAQNINVTFQDQKITGIIGESGSGKSVLGMSILRLLPENARIEGTCMYQDRDLYHVSEKEIQKLRGREIGLIPQNPQASLNPMRKLSSQLREALLVHRLESRSGADKRVETLMRSFGFEDLGEYWNKYPFQMSGGMNQRMVSILGLACAPKWLIADEPTKGLDAVMRRQVYQVLRRSFADCSGGMIVITHDLTLAYHLCDDICVMYQGEIVEQGPCRLVMDKPLHPYTKGLMAAMPERGMHPIAGEIREREAQVGCRFYERCQEALSACRDKKLEDFTVDGERKVRCVLYD